jgi:hypothetical protein
MWQGARSVGGPVGFVFWVKVGPPKEFAPDAYRTNLLGRDLSRLYAEAATVELIPIFTDDVSLVDLRSELVTQGFTETGTRA